MNRSMNRWTLFLIIAIGLCIFPLYVAQSASTATLSVHPVSITASQGQNFTINVTISNVLDLYGWEFKLNWTTTLVNVTEVTEGPFLKAGGGTFFTCNMNTTGGRMVVDCTLLGSVSGVNGTGTLATITFYARSVGQSPLNLYDVILINSSDQVIPSQATGGYAYITYGHDVAVTAVNFSPTALLAGGLVNINATVENLGGYSEKFNVTAYANSKSIGKKGVSLSYASSTNVAFVWNTTGYGFGDYAMSVSASVVPGETNTANNVKVANNTLTILYQGHKIAVTGVQPDKMVLGQGFPMFVVVHVKNYGTFNETFNNTVYVNTTIIQTQTVTLISGKGAPLSFLWDSTSFAKGNYTVWAYAWPVRGETDTANNTLKAVVPVEITIPGDVDGNYVVDILDVVKITSIYASKQGDPQFNSNCDIDNDGKITILDVVICTSHYAQKYP
jgi:hypothetical protein